MRILLTAAGGQLGPYLHRELEQREHDVVAWAGRRQFDLTDADALRRGFEAADPDVVLHTAALSKPAACHADPGLAERVNVVATQQLTELAEQRNARLVFTSTDMVFDGERGLYAEHDPPRPVMIYGQTKLDAEHAVLGSRDNVVVRLSLLFGPGIGGVRTLFDQHVAALRAGEPIRLFHDEYRTPLALPLAAAALADVCHPEAPAGLFHVGGAQRVNRLELGRILADALNADPACLQSSSRLSVPSDEPRPCDTSLRSERFREHFPTPLETDLARLVPSLI